MKAPNFSLPDQHEKTHTLADYTGKYVLIYFYPKDMTSGCTVEAESFRDHFQDFKKKGVAVIGVSKDPVKSHQKFVEKHGLNFPLLADTETNMAEAYGVWVEKSMYGRKYMGIQRDSFLIGPDGTIIKQYKKVKPAEHVTQVLSDLAEITG